MNDSLGHNLKTIIGDQQLKLEMINNIDPERIGFDPKSLFAKIMEIIQLIGTIILLIQFMCATNPATIAISGILLIVDFVFSVIAIINNIKTIEELKKKKAELEEFLVTCYSGDDRHIDLLTHTYAGEQIADLEFAEGI